MKKKHRKLRCWKISMFSKHHPTLKPTNFGLWRTVCEPFADAAAGVRRPVHTYMHLVREPFASSLRTIWCAHVYEARYIHSPLSEFQWYHAKFKTNVSALKAFVKDRAPDPQIQMPIVCGFWDVILFAWTRLFPCYTISKDLKGINCIINEVPISLISCHIFLSTAWHWLNRQCSVWVTIWAKGWPLFVLNP